MDGKVKVLKKSEVNEDVLEGITSEQLSYDFELYKTIESGGYVYLYFKYIN